MGVLFVASSFPGSAPQVEGVCTWPCVSDLASRAAAEAAAEPPSGVGAAFGQHIVQDLCTAAQYKGLRLCFPEPEPSCGEEEHHLAASQGAWHEDRT